MSNVARLFPEPVTMAEPSRFEEIWKRWPNKAKKVVAKAKYDAILKGKYSTRTLDKDSGQYIEIELSATQDQILAGVIAYIDSQIDKRTFRLRDDGKFIPMLCTWLNQGRWSDGE